MKITRDIRRILCILICLCIAVSFITVTGFSADGSSCAAFACDGTYANGFCSLGSSHYEEATQNSDGVYEISNAGQLYWFAKLVDGGATDADAVLTQDITVNQNVLIDGELNEDLEDDFRTWNPIGSNSKKYLGVFDGGNYTVSGLYYNKDGTLAGYVGLFATLGEGAEVRNVTIADSYLGAESNVGSIAGSNVGGTVENCTNLSVIFAAGSNAGGITGNNNGGTIRYCANIGTVIGENENVGGIAGVSKGTIERCFNAAAVIGDGNSNESYVGGITGRNENDNLISDCYNTGAISSDGEYVGGISGTAYGSTIKNSYNTGAVSGKGYVGAILGGHYSNPYIVNCYYLGTAETDGYGSTAVKSAEQFAGGEVCMLLNGSTGVPAEGETLAWYQNLDAEDTEPDASPVLDDSHGIVNYGYKNCSEQGYTNRADFEIPGNHEDIDQDNKCDHCGADVEDVTEPSKPEETDPSDPSDPSEPKETDPSDPSEPEQTDSTDPSKPEEKDPTDPSKPEETDTADPSEPKVPECPKDATCILSKYSDIIVNDWYHDGIHFCVEEGIMNGMSDTTFEPGTNTSRAMLVTMLYRMEGKPSIEGMTEPFTDVAEGEWYYDSIVWAYNNGVVKGMTDTTFEPNTSVSREQVATIMHRYNDTPAGTGKLSGFPDVDSVSAYAKDALIWAVGEGLINGVAQTDGTSNLDPTGNATRAQIATILMRYLTAQ